MTLSEYVVLLTKLVKDNPAAADMPVIYSRDDEGNGFKEVCYAPSVGCYDGEDFETTIDKGDKDNAVCIN